MCLGVAWGRMLPQGIFEIHASKNSTLLLLTFAECFHITVPQVSHKVLNVLNVQVCRNARLH